MKRSQKRPDSDHVTAPPARRPAPTTWPALVADERLGFDAREQEILALHGDGMDPHAIAARLSGPECAGLKPGVRREFLRQAERRITWFLRDAAKLIERHFGIEVERAVDEHRRELASAYRNARTFGGTPTCLIGLTYQAETLAARIAADLSISDADARRQVNEIFADPNSVTERQVRSPLVTSGSFARTERTQKIRLLARHFAGEAELEAAERTEREEAARRAVLRELIEARAREVRRARRFPFAG